MSQRASAGMTSGLPVKLVLMTPQLGKKLPGMLHVPQATQCTLTEGLVANDIHVYQK